MQRFSGYDEAKKQAQNQGGAKLPAGAYVCKVLAVKYENSTDGMSDRIAVQFDVNEGEQKDFFKKQYEANTSEDKKWKGSVRIYVPTDDGSEKDAWTKRSFASWTDSFEKSNPGYSWDWDESKWKNKIVGIVFGTTGTVISGRNITYTEPRFPVDAETVRSGKAPEARFKAKNGYKESTSGSQNQPVDADGFLQVPEGVEEEIPF